MANYVLRRMIYLIFQVFLVLSLMFIIFRLLPGDPARLVLGPLASEAEYARYRMQMGLNDPISVQYLRYLQELMTGNLGSSTSYSQSVTAVILPRIWPTVRLMLCSLGLAVFIGVPAGVFTGIYPDSKVAKGIMGLWVALLAVPNFWLGLLLVQLFAVRLNLLPSIFAGTLLSMVLPTLAIASRLIALIARMTRSAVMEVANEDYVHFAQAKGLYQWAVVVRHILRPALPPIITMIGMQAGYLLGGSVVIENLFSYPGMGQLLLAAVSARDYALMQGITLFFVITFLLINLLVDLLYSQVDPRIRLE